jgi:hypothetical protein
MKVIANVAQLLGVDPRADRKTFTKALERELALRDKTDPQAAAQLQADERLLDQAAKDGKIIAASRPHWLKALREDRAGAKAMLAVLAAVPKQVHANLDGSSRTGAVQEIADPEVERISAYVTGRPFETTQRPQAPVRAAAQPTPASGRTDQPTVTTMDEMNAMIESDPPLHRHMWASGCRDGLKPPQEQFVAYPDVDVPWDPKPQLVMHEDGTGHWETPRPDDKWLSTQGPGGESRTGDRRLDIE